MRNRLAFLLSSIIMALVLCAPVAWADTSTDSNNKDNNQSREVELQILSTSDTHGAFYPWDYSNNKAYTNGSLAQIATAVKKIRRPNSLLLDAGDLVQGSDSKIFLVDNIHPNILAFNYMGYDALTTGNHEYNFGSHILNRLYADSKAPLLVCNVYTPTGERLAQPYKIFNKGGLRVAVIGIVTPNITRWDSVNLKGWKVTDPVLETQSILNELKDKADVFIALTHMGFENEYGVENSGTLDLANKCPQLNYILTSHSHTGLQVSTVNDVLVSQNRDKAQTLSEVRLCFQKNSDGKWQLTRRGAKLHEMQKYAPDPELMKLLEPYHQKALSVGRTKVGVLTGSLLPPAEIKNIHPALLQPTALIGFLNDVAMHYADAKVACSPLLDDKSRLKTGDITKWDIVKIYKYDNYLYKIQMNGKQLRKFMESNAKFYNNLGKDDLTVSFNPTIRIYNHYMFSGINYETNISRPFGKRIEKLTWADGTPVKDDDVFVLACCDYCAKTNLLAYGPVFEPGEELPVLLEANVHSEIGDIRELISDYIAKVKKGKLTPETPTNWRLTGTTWDPQLHKEAVELLNQGKLQFKPGKDDRSCTPLSITIDDLNAAKAQTEK